MVRRLPPLRGRSPSAADIQTARVWALCRLRRARRPLRQDTQGDDAHCQPRGGAVSSFALADFLHHSTVYPGSWAVLHIIPCRTIFVVISIVLAIYSSVILTCLHFLFIGAYTSILLHTPRSPRLRIRVSSCVGTVLFDVSRKSEIKERVENDFVPFTSSFRKASVSKTFLLPLRTERGVIMALDAPTDLEGGARHRL